MSAEPDYAKAHADLTRAISAYYEATTGEYVDGWILAVHKLSPELEQQQTTAVGVLTADGQSFVMSRGLLEIAAESPGVTGRPE